MGLVDRICVHSPRAFGMNRWGLSAVIAAKDMGHTEVGILNAHSAVCVTPGPPQVEVARLGCS